MCYYLLCVLLCLFFFFSSRRRHTRFDCDWSSDVCSSDLGDRGRSACAHRQPRGGGAVRPAARRPPGDADRRPRRQDRKSTRLNSSHSQISYAVFCLKKKKNTTRWPSSLVVQIRRTRSSPAS